MWYHNALSYNRIHTSDRRRDRWLCVCEVQQLPGGPSPLFPHTSSRHKFPPQVPAKHRFLTDFTGIFHKPNRNKSNPTAPKHAPKHWHPIAHVPSRYPAASRSRMRHAVGDKLVYCHEALHLRAKLQKAGYHQVAEKWDSDSDSDESDEEDLKM